MLNIVGKGAVLLNEITTYETIKGPNTTIKKDFTISISMLMSLFGYLALSPGLYVT